MDMPDISVIPNDILFQLPKLLIDIDASTENAEQMQSNQRCNDSEIFMSNCYATNL